ncbi:HEAT repeat domain-containing protein [Micromonospora sp. NPDC007271]|uniref:HEAT repeat domain-containing protein n=1 Tax=Micromonospora sp. NPDC007271 TaxID=3154587 RepID=UPI0033CE9742
MLAVKGQAWKAAKLLADIGRPDDDVVQALHAALTRSSGPDQSWVARALSRLGRLDLVLAQIDRLPREVVVGAVAAPYTSFRNQAVTAPRLDYRPLQDVIERRPAYATALAQELQPGRGYCDVTVDEVDDAIRGLASPHVVIRRHAVCVLGERRLGAAVARRALPVLAQIVSQDPDVTVRRLAILSLLWWRKDSQRYGNVVREALNDPAADVREVAAHWLREQNDGPA